MPYFMIAAEAPLLDPDWDSAADIKCAIAQLREHAQRDGALNLHPDVLDRHSYQGVLDGKTPWQPKFTKRELERERREREHTCAEAKDRLNAVGGSGVQRLLEYVTVPEQDDFDFETTTRTRSRRDRDREEIEKIYTEYDRKLEEAWQLPNYRTWRKGITVYYGPAPLDPENWTVDAA